LQGREVPAHLLDPDDVEARDELGDAPEVEEIAPRAVARLRAPFRRQAAERSQVPGGDEEVSIELLRRDDGVERPPQLEEPGAKRSRKGIVDAGRETVLPRRRR
jgi:hypothetical protein